MHRFQPTARPELGRTKVKAGSRARRVPTRSGWENRSGRRTPLPPEGARRPVGRAGRRGGRGGRRGLGRGVGRRASRDATDGGVSYVDIRAQGLLVRHLVLKHDMVSRGVGEN